MKKEGVPKADTIRDAFHQAATVGEVFDRDGQTFGAADRSPKRTCHEVGRIMTHANDRRIAMGQ